MDLDMFNIYKATINVIFVVEFLLFPDTLEAVFLFSRLDGGSRE